MVIRYSRFGTTYRSHLQGQSSTSIIDPRRRVRMVFPKRRYGVTILRCLKSQNSADFKYCKEHRNCLRNNTGYNLEGKGSTIILNAEIPYQVKHCYIPEEFAILEMLIWTSCCERRYVKGQTFNLPSLARIKGHAFNSSKWEILKHTKN